MILEQQFRISEIAWRFSLRSEIPYDPSTSMVCYLCAKRRVERKEIITEIVDTEVKYGRDLRIIRDEFQRPMQVAGLLTREQLDNIFLNVEELVEVNRRFTAALKASIDTALVMGGQEEDDEDLTTVSIGKIFLDMEPEMLRSFKSYCTRQVRILKNFNRLSAGI